MFVPRKPSTFILVACTWGMFNEEENYYSSSLCSLPSTCRPVNCTVIKIIRMDLKILTFISGHKGIVSLL
jgi:hypothetical protein